MRVNPIFPASYLYNVPSNFSLGNLTSVEESTRRFQSLDTEHERPQVYLLLGDIRGRERDYVDATEQKKSFKESLPKALP